MLTLTEHRLNQVWREISIVDLILMDHRYIKECIEVLKDEYVDKKRKLSMSRGFLEALRLHSIAEKNAVYRPLEANEEFRAHVLEAKIEHGIVDKKVRVLKPKVVRSRLLKDDIEIEMKVLAELVEHHLIEEESVVLPKLKNTLDVDQLSSMGKRFMKFRKFSQRELQDYPLLEDELIQWKDSVQKISSQILQKMDHYVENLKH